MVPAKTKETAEDYAELIEKLAHCFGLNEFIHLTEFIEFSHLTEFIEFSPKQ